MSGNLFIAFEGIDGSGKSTQVRQLASYLESIGHRVYTTFEPTDNPIGRMIRDIFSHRMEADQRVIAALFVADRLHHLLNRQDGILKKLEEGYTVITDRYYFSSYAYHAVHDIDMQWIIEANRLSAGLLKPHFHVFLEISPEKSMERIQRGRSEIEMYETLENQQLVYQQYHKAFELLKDSETIISINADQATEKVTYDVLQAVSKMLN